MILTIIKPQKANRGMDMSPKYRIPAMGYMTGGIPIRLLAIPTSQPARNGLT